ncbi:MAG: hypothetical protein K5888_05265 [Lachnospiraceae bacterium]|nr:hypothetical protein [Lachnospiraceae bacterium]
MPESSYEFKKALGNMTREVAYKASVRHLTDNEYSLDQIMETLSYPVSREEVQKTMYEHMLESGIICEKLPDEDAVKEKISYVLEEGAYGKKSYRRVTEPGTAEKHEYVPCDFGTLNEAGWDKLKDKLDKKDIEYISGIPWPKKTVYHRMTERFKGIYTRLMA